MKKIWLGLLFVVIPVPIHLLTGYSMVNPELLSNPLNLVGINNVNWMPAFLGYLLIFLGLRRSWPSDTVVPTRLLAIGSAVLIGALWAFYLSGQAMPFPLEQSARILMTWRLLKWCEEQEDWDWGFRIQRLRLSWYALTGATLAGIVLGAADLAMGMLWSGVALGAGLYYVYTFARMSRMVDEETKP